jgi:beta-lactamase class A
MENQFANQTPPNYYKRRLAGLFVFAIFLLILGRNLPFLPVINLSMNTKEVDMQNSIEKIIKNKSGSYSVYYKDLRTGKSFGIDENQIETGASVNKVPIIAALYYLNEKGKISLDQKVTIQKADVQDYGTGTIRYQSMPVTYSLRNLAKLALKQSDNTAAHVIEITIGEDVVQGLVNSWGMKQTNMIDNKTTAYDMSLLFDKIYKNQITSVANTKEMLGFMTSTDFEDRLTKNLPQNVTIYHKTGDGVGFVHDVGIFVTPKGTYYLGVMTSDVDGKEDEAKNTMSEISRKIFDSLNN